MWNTAISQAPCDQSSEMIATMYLVKYKMDFMYMHIYRWKIKVWNDILQNKVYKDNQWNLNVKFVNTSLTIFYNFVNTDKC